MKKEMIFTDRAPSPIGPYSQAVAVKGSLVFISGQIPLNPVTGEVIYDDIKSATTQCIENIKAIAERAGCSLYNVVKTTLFIKNMDQFPVINEVYGTYFAQCQHARSCIQAAKLPKDVEIEIEAILVKEDN